MIIIAKKCGRLGNRLRLSAHVIAFAEEHGRAVHNPSFDEYAQHFETTAADTFCRYPAHPGAAGGSAARRALYYAGRIAAGSRLFHTVSLRHGETLLLDDAARARDVEAILGARVVLLSGFAFRCPTLLDKHAQKVRDYFRPIRAHADAVARLIAETRRPGEALVGMHMRFGDYKTYLGGRYYYELPVYLDVMRRCKEQLGGQPVRFLICTDGALDASAFDGLDVRFGTNHMIEDLHALAECDYIVGPPSTFSHWASFYGQKPLTVILDAKEPFILARSTEGPRAA